MLRSDGDAAVALNGVSLNTVELDAVPIGIAMSARRPGTDAVGAGVGIGLGATVIVGRVRFGFGADRSNRVPRPNRLAIE